MMQASGRGLSALHDLSASLSRHWLWTALGWHDIRQRYRGSLLGPFWITINIALLVGCLTLVFAEPLGSDRRGYVPYVAIGLVIWYFIQGTLNDACQVLVGAGETIRHTSMPLPVHVLRLLWRNTLVLAHNVFVVPVVLIAFGVRLDVWFWMAVPGFALLWIAVLCASLLLGLAGARFRDVSQIVTNLLQLLFFLTPVFWPIATVGPTRAMVIGLNPIFAFIDIIRSPLIGTAPATASWPIALATTAITAMAAFGALSLWRNRVAYWV